MQGRQLEGVDIARLTETFCELCREHCRTRHQLLHLQGLLCRNEGIPGAFRICCQMMNSGLGPQQPRFITGICLLTQGRAQQQPGEILRDANTGLIAAASLRTQPGQRQTGIAQLACGNDVGGSQIQPLILALHARVTRQRMQDGI